MLGASAENTVLFGDQIFADILSGYLLRSREPYSKRDILRSAEAFLSISSEKSVVSDQCVRRVRRSSKFLGTNEENRIEQFPMRTENYL